MAEFGLVKRVVSSGLGHGLSSSNSRHSNTDPLHLGSCCHGSEALVSSRPHALRVQERPSHQMQSQTKSSVPGPGYREISQGTGVHDADGTLSSLAELLFSATRTGPHSNLFHAPCSQAGTCAPPIRVAAFETGSSTARHGRLVTTSNFLGGGYGSHPRTSGEVPG
jgi:hypothetical protein